MERVGEGRAMPFKGTRSSSKTIHYSYRRVPKIKNNKYFLVLYKLH
jgi:hypothetical protein